jgi:hypothetical protein
MLDAANRTEGLAKCKAWISNSAVDRSNVNSSYTIRIGDSVYDVVVGYDIRVKGVELYPR